MKKHWENYVKKTKCEKCAKEFFAYIYNLQRGWGKFCSHSCSKKDNYNRKGQTFTEEQRKKISKTLKKKFQSGELISPLKTLGIIGKSGEKAPNWQGGKSFMGQKIRNTKQYDNWRSEVFKRDDFTCRLCKKRGGKIEADHIVPVSRNRKLIFDISNGRTLCVDCHKRVTFGWKPFETDFRRAFIDSLVKIAETDKRILMLTCDVGFSFLEQWKEKYPDRFFNFGVTEMSTTIIASALSLDGHRPIFYSMINFVIYRSFEAIRNAIGYHNAPVLLAGVQGSAKYKMLGFSHTSIKNEDIDHLVMVPNMRIYLPMKDEEVGPMLKKIFSENYPAYIRL